eukprot:3684197-Amphidinium_carterae.1
MRAIGKLSFPRSQVLGKFVEPVLTVLSSNPRPAYDGRLSSEEFQTQQRLGTIWASWPAFPWFARVPSHANVSDALSRGRIRECAEDLGAE